MAALRGTCAFGPKRVIGSYWLKSATDAPGLITARHQALLRQSVTRPFNERERRRHRDNRTRDGLTRVDVQLRYS